MPIDVEKAVGASFEPSRFTWEDRDIILYHLGIGAGTPPTDEGELRYTYEGDLVVLPSYATIPPFSTLMGVGMVDGVDINLANVLHGEQEIELFGPIPTTGAVDQVGRITGVYDKGKNALITTEIESTHATTGEPLFINRSSVVVRGEGGFGGDSGPSSSAGEATGPPEMSVEAPTLPQQALLYRMSSGDLNPLHVDPGFAMFAGFDRPILHGLCTYGVVLKAVVDHLLDGDVSAVGSYRARFSGIVYPGETVVVSGWQSEDGVIVEATTRERGKPVLTNGLVRTI